MFQGIPNHITAAQNAAQTERRVLGAMLLDPRCVPQAVEQLEPEDFFFKQNREIFRSIRSLFRMGAIIDGVTVLENLWQSGAWDAVCYRTYISQLIAATPTSAEVAEDIKRLKAQLAAAQTDAGKDVISAV